MLVWIVYAVTPDRRGPDVERMARIEQVDDDLGRLLLQTGEARQPTADEVAEYEKANAEPQPDEPAPVVEAASNVESAPAKKTGSK